MEPLTHTLVGALAGEAGLKHRTPLAMAALVTGSILPDVEGVCYLAGSDVALQYRRGWTHGVAAMAVLPLALTGLLLLYDRLWRRRRHPDLAPAKPGWLLLVSFIGVLTHPILDWTNNYGVRLLMPFNGQWFYGDAVFIVDPWLWLIAGTAVVLMTPRGRGMTELWTAIAVLTSALVLFNPLVPAAARIVWMGLAALLAVLRVRLRRPLGARYAWVSLAATTLYLLLMIGGARQAERQAKAAGEREGWTVQQAVSVPSPANPFLRHVIVVTPDRYVFVPVSWPGGPDMTPPFQSLPRAVPTAASMAAMSSPQVRGLRGWLRFPSYDAQLQRDGSYRVIIRDARFAAGNLPGFGVVATVNLDSQLRPMQQAR